jgi:hypothetical protein
MTPKISAFSEIKSWMKEMNSGLWCRWFQCKRFIHWTSSGDSYFIGNKLMIEFESNRSSMLGKLKSIHHPFFMMMIFFSLSHFAKKKYVFHVVMVSLGKKTMCEIGLLINWLIFSSHLASHRRRKVIIMMNFKIFFLLFFSPFFFWNENFSLPSSIE